MAQQPDPSTGANKRQCTLEPIDLHNKTDFAELIRQRQLCGWNNQPTHLEAWRQRVDDSTLALFWIVPAHLAAEEDPARRRAGHIGLSRGTHPPDLDVANPDGSMLLLTTFFILSEHRASGLGRSAVAALEARAHLPPVGSPTCRALSVQTISRRYFEDSGDEWRGIDIRRGKGPRPRGASQEDWFARMGFVKWREEAAIPETLLDGTEVMLVEVSMRKSLI